MTQREFFLKAVLALASTGRYTDRERMVTYTRSLIRDAMSITLAIDEEADPSAIDGYNDDFFQDISWSKRLDFLEADLHAIMKKFEIEIPKNA